MNVETILHQADPVASAQVPNWDSFESERILREVLLRAEVVPSAKPRTVERRARIVFAGTVVATATVITLLLGATAPTLSGASTVFVHLANTAAGESTTLDAGEAYYTEIEAPIVVRTEISESGAPYSWYLQGRIQTWVSVDGSGTQVVTTDPTPEFFTTADRAAWISAGSPALPDPQPLSTTVTFDPGTASTLNSADPLFNVSDLPTDPTALASILGAENKGRTSFGQLPAGISQLDSGTLFSRTIALLEGPDVGMSTALRSALYQVLASTPGIQLLGAESDRLGREGVGFQMTQTTPSGEATETCTEEGRSITIHEPYQATTTTFTVIIDPNTANILSSTKATSPANVSVTPDPCRQGSTPEHTEINPSWSIVLTQGVSAFHSP